MTDNWGPPNQRFSNPKPDKPGLPCPTCTAIRPKGWRGPCIHCLNRRPPRRPVGDDAA